MCSLAQSGDNYPSLVECMRGIIYTRCLHSDSYVFVIQAEDGIRDLVRSRGLGDVYKSQDLRRDRSPRPIGRPPQRPVGGRGA